MATSTLLFPTTPSSSLSSTPHSPPFPISANPRRLRQAPSSAAAAFRFLRPREAVRAKSDLLSLISDQERGLRTQRDPSKRAEIVVAIEALAAAAKGSVTTGPPLSATWRMLWTTEKEQLFIIKNAPFFGTEAGDVLQVIDVEKGTLNNVITFPPSGVFFVRSSIEAEPPQRINFKFTSAVLRGSNWEIPLPPFGKGWFESVYLDEDIRVVKDIRGDYLVVDRAPYSWKE
ncbi:probable plastid-lipid-associated protein 11 [Ananas comosus]|uniref:Probable plastid-lipid-associated protein 11 n=1 Tax=Ananas comosus TaxID=4615 RepID=A0A6P5FCL7_ANACO|nr:probable plastid-lipid-associated protein 11 [Ananas comosus]